MSKPTINPETDKTPIHKMAIAVVLTGFLGGVAGLLATLILWVVEHLLFTGEIDFIHITDSTLVVESERFTTLILDSQWHHRLLGFLLCGLAAGLIWYALRRTKPLQKVSNILETGERFSLTRACVNACTQLLIVGSGASIGREGAPRLVGAAGADWLGRKLELDKRSWAYLLCIGAGAGLAGVYTVPLSGVAFACEVTYKKWDWRLILWSLPACYIAMFLCYPLVGPRQYPGVDVGSYVNLWLIPPTIFIAGLSGLYLRFLIDKARSHMVPDRFSPVAITLVGLLMFGLSFLTPLLMGNGIPALDQVLYNKGGFLLFGAIIILKPIMTAAYLQAGAIGGLLTPSMSVGGASGAFIAALFNQGDQTVFLGLIGAVITLAITERAPIFAILMIIELTGLGINIT